MSSYKKRPSPRPLVPGTSCPSDTKIKTAKLSSREATGLSCREASLVTRRGSPVVLEIIFSRPITQPYTVTLSFVPVHGPRERSCTFRASGQDGKGLPGIWLSIELPARFPIGMYDAHISVTQANTPEILTHTLYNEVVVLFNPSLEDDEVYIEENVEEYVLSDIGVLWRGTQTKPDPLLWEYGQYEPYCLEVALLLLKKLKVDKRRSAAHVSRAIISQISPPDNPESGILAVSCSGRYRGGTHPSKWTSSAPILQKYYRTRSPIKYGQCWTTAALAVTLLRILGIPCRPVTCYNPAMSTKQLGRVNKYFTPEGNLIDNVKPSDDHIWAYHVWIECWMNREEISTIGWNLIDCSTNDGPVSGIGPIPVKILHDSSNRTYSNNDISRISSIIHSEVRYQRVVQTHATMSNQICTLAQTQTNQTGTRIVTSSTSDRMEWTDITTEYREPNRHEAVSPTVQYPLLQESNDCKMRVDCSHVCVGQDLQITIILQNKSPMLRTIDGRVVGGATHYTGHNKKTFVSLQFEGSIAPHNTGEVVLTVTSRQYLRHLKDQNFLHFFVIAKARETQQLFFDSQYHKLDPLPLTIKGPGTVKVGQLVRYSISFHNPLSSSLSHISFILQAKGLFTHKEVAYRRLLLPDRSAVVDITVQGSVPGTHTLLASMHCDQLTDIHNWTTLIITT